MATLAACRAVSWLECGCFWVACHRSTSAANGAPLDHATAEQKQRGYLLTELGRLAVEEVLSDPGVDAIGLDQNVCIESGTVLKSQPDVVGHLLDINQLVIERDCVQRETFLQYRVQVAAVNAQMRTAAP